MKFSIRDIMLVTVIVALAVGWVVDRRNHQKMIIERDAAINKAKEDALELKLEGLIASKRLDRLQRDNEKAVGDLKSLGIDAEISPGGRLSFPGEGFNSRSGGFSGRFPDSSAPAPNRPSHDP
jgi:hypothetical protein